MKTNLIVIGKTANKHIAALVDDYKGRLKHYIPFEITYLQDARRNTGISQNQQKEQEAEMILKQINSADYVVLLDERGQTFTSMKLSAWLNKRQNTGRNIVFVIGGPYGFSQRMYDRADELISLSSLTFSHDLARLILTEQIYRACT